jgi:hypothetical protein
MLERKYTRQTLTATRNGGTDPTSLVSEWLDVLETTTDGKSTVGPTEEAFDILSCYARLQRTREDLLDTGAMTLTERVGELLKKHGRDLAERALDLPDPAGWRAQAEVLEDSYCALVDPVERAGMARQLISDLDDADLVLAMAERLGLQDSELAVELAACNQWLMDHADSFLAAGTWIQSSAQTIREDIDTIDAGLALTTRKFLKLLDIMEDAEWDLASRDRECIALEAFQMLLRRVETVGICRFPNPASLPDYTLEHVISGLGLAPMQSREHRGRCVWVCPEGGIIAEMLVPDRPHRDTQLCIEYRDQTSGRPAPQLCGKSVWLAGIKATIDAEGKATFPYAAVRDSTESKLSLRLETYSEPWHPTEP